MELNTLTALSPLDGRYRNKIEALAPYFSEFGLIKHRVLIEVEYLIALARTGVEPLAHFPQDIEKDLRLIVEKFSLEDAQHIKEIEKTTNHDVKAVEYFIKNKLEALGLSQFTEFVHFWINITRYQQHCDSLFIKKRHSSSLHTCS